MNIVMQVSLSSTHAPSARAGDILNLPDTQAEEWIANGWAKADPVENRLSSISVEKGPSARAKRSHSTPAAKG